MKNFEIESADRQALIDELSALIFAVHFFSMPVCAERIVSRNPESALASVAQDIEARACERHQGVQTELHAVPPLGNFDTMARGTLIELIRALDAVLFYFSLPEREKRIFADPTHQSRERNVLYAAIEDAICDRYHGGALKFKKSLEIRLNQE